MPETETTTLSRQPRKRWALRFALIFAAITAILAYATYWLASKDRQQSGQIQQLQGELHATQVQSNRDAADLRAVAGVVSAPDTISVTLQQQAGGPPGQAHVLYNERLGVAIYSGQISPAPAGKTYQLWALPASGAPVNAGMVAANQENGAVVVRLQQGVVAKSFVVTLESAAGQAQPTGPKVLVGTVGG